MPFISLPVDGWKLIAQYLPKDTTNLFAGLDHSCQLMFVHTDGRQIITTCEGYEADRKKIKPTKVCGVWAETN